MLGANGALYGTTYYGGSHSVGALYKLNTDGSGFSVLRNFGLFHGRRLQPRRRAGAKGGRHDLRHGLSGRQLRRRHVYTSSTRTVAISASY